MKRAQHISTSALVGGFTAETFGGNFWEGARQGATSAALNHLGNHIQDNYKAKKAQNGGSGKTIIYQRTSETSQSTTGTFSIPASGLTGYFLEPAGPSTITPNQNKRIPARTYNVEKFSGEKYKNVFRLYNEQVSKNRGILIHSGSIPDDTKGCLLCAYNNPSPDFVNGSKNMLNSLRTLQINKLNIYDVIPK